MKKLKSLYKYLIIFLASLFSCCILNCMHNYSDPIYNYFTSHAILFGKVPYLDYNLITTPLYAFYTSILLHVYDDFSMFLVSQSILVAVSFYLIYNLYGKKSYILLLITSMIGYCNLTGTYNYMCFFMMVVLVYLEKKYSNKDYLIGFVIALAVLSKHTVGIFLIIPSLIFYYKDKKKLFKRLVGFIIPIIIFIIYLFVTGSMNDFINLCILGLFDFANHNGATSGKINYLFVILTFIFMIISIIIIIKNKKNICNYYLFFGLFFTVPLFDYFHFSMYLNCISIMLIPYIKINEKLLSRVCIISSLFIAVFIMIWYINHDITISKNNHYKYTLNFKDDYKQKLKIIKFINKFENPIYIGYSSPYYITTNDLEIIPYLTIYCYGNYGYDGIKNTINRINNIHNRIFIVSMEDYNNKYKYSQFPKELAKYIIKK